MCRSEEVYNDPSMIVQAVFNNPQELKPVEEGDERELVKMANAVESSYSQLGEVGILQTVILPQVNTLGHAPWSGYTDSDRL